MIDLLSRRRLSNARGVGILAICSVAFLAPTRAMAASNDESGPMRSHIEWRIGSPEGGGEFGRYLSVICVDEAVLALINYISYSSSQKASPEDGDLETEAGSTPESRLAIVDMASGRLRQDLAIALDGRPVGKSRASAGVVVPVDGSAKLASRIRFGVPGLTKGGAVLDLDLESGDFSQWLESSKNEAGLGAAILGVGDVSSDGVDDYLVGAPRDYGFHVNREKGEGEICVRSGVDGSPIWCETGVPGFGRFVLVQPDISGDARPDVIVMSPWHRDRKGDVAFGAVMTAYSGSNGDALWRSDVLSSSQESLVYVRGLISTDDWNQDGVDDTSVVLEEIKPTGTENGVLFGKVICGKSGETLASVDLGFAESGCRLASVVRGGEPLGGGEIDFYEVDDLGGRAMSLGVVDMGSGQLLFSAGSRMLGAFGNAEVVYCSDDSGVLFGILVGRNWRRLSPMDNGSGYVEYYSLSG